MVEVNLAVGDLLDRNALTARPDVLLAGGGIALIELADVPGDAAARLLLHPPAVAVVGKRRGLPAAGDAGGPILDVVAVERAPRAGQHIAVGVVAVAVASRRGDRVRADTR